MVRRRYNGHRSSEGDVPMKQKLSTKKLVLTALMAALTVIGSWMRIAIPVDIGGNSYFHLGNILCALSGILLGPWLGGLAAGMGSAIYDIIFYPMFISECWITFLTKACYGLMAGLVIRCGSREWGYVRAVLAALAGAVTYALLYLAKAFFKAIFVEGVGIFGGWIAVGLKVPATIFNAAVAVIFAPILAVAIRTALKKNHLSID